MRDINEIIDTYIEIIKILSIVSDGDRKDDVAIKLREIVTSERAMVMYDYIRGLQEHGIEHFIKKSVN